MRPSIISCKTVIGYGSPNKQGTAGSHGAPLGEDEINLVRKSMKWEYKPFFIPEEIINLWRKAGIRNKQSYENWIKKNESRVKNYKISSEDFIKKISDARINSSKFFF